MAETSYDYRLDEHGHSIMRLVSEKVSGFTPLHVVEFPWIFSVQSYGISYSTERSITLMENTILSVYRDINNATAYDICENFGFPEGVVRRIIQNLRDIGALSSVLGQSSDMELNVEPPPEKETWLNLPNEEKLSSIEGLSSWAIDELIDEFERHTTGPGARKLAQYGEYFDTLKGLRTASSIRRSKEKWLANRKEEEIELGKLEITDSGRKFLIEQKVPESTKVLRDYDFAFSIYGEEWHPTTGVGFAKYDLEIPKDRSAKTRKLRNLKVEEAALALKRSGPYEEEQDLVVTEVKPQYEGKLEDSYRSLNVYVTLAVSNGGGARFFVHNRSKDRVKWMEKIVNSKKFEGKKDLHRIFKQRSPLVGIGLTNQYGDISGIHNLASGINEFCYDRDDRSPIFLNLGGSDRPLSQVDGSSTKALEGLYRIRTTVEVTPEISEQLDVVSTGPPPKYRIGISEFNMPDLSFSSSESAFCITNTKLLVGGLEYEVSVLLADRELASRTSRMISKLREEGDDPLRKYLFSGSKTDLVHWVNSQVDSIVKLSEVPSILSEAESHTATHGKVHDFRSPFFTRLFSSRTELFENDWAGNCLDLIESISQTDSFSEPSWRLIEPYLQQSILNLLDSSGPSNSELSEIWRKHRSGEELLAWEDGARLEFDRFGSTGFTRVLIATRTEEIVSEIQDLIVGDGSRFDKTSKKLTQLSEHIGKDLYNESMSIIKQRNPVVHVSKVFVKTALEPTLSAISIARKLAVFVDRREYSEGRWRQPTNNSWDSPSLTNEMLTSYFSQLQSISDGLKSKELYPTWNLWLDPLVERLPLSIDEYPIGLFSLLTGFWVDDNESQEPLKELIEQIHSKSKDSLLESQPIESLFSEELVQTINRLEEIGLNSQSVNLIEGSIRRVKRPSSLSDMINQAKMASDFGWDKFPQLANHLNSKVWVPSVKQNLDFTCKLDELVADSPLDGNMNKGLRNELFRHAFVSSFGTQEISSPGHLNGIFSTITKLKMKSKVWENEISKFDGFIQQKITEHSKKVDDSSATSSAFQEAIPILENLALPRTIDVMKELISQNDSRK